MKTFTSHKREVEEEAWKNLAVYPVETLNESYDPSEAHVKNQEYAPIEAYLENMSHKETKKDSEYDRALRDKLMEYLWDGQAASYSHLKAKFGDYSEEDLNDNLKILCWAVRGFFTLKGCIRYQRDQRSDMARDKVISALNELLAPNVQIPVTKRDTVAKLAKTEGQSQNWLLLVPEGEPVDNELTQENGRKTMIIPLIPINLSARQEKYNVFHKFCLHLFTPLERNCQIAWLNGQKPCAAGRFRRVLLDPPGARQGVYAPRQFRIDSLRQHPSRLN